MNAFLMIWDMFEAAPRGASDDDRKCRFILGVLCTGRWGYSWFDISALKFGDGLRHVIGDSFKNIESGLFGSHLSISFLLFKVFAIGA